MLKLLLISRWGVIMLVKGNEILLKVYKEGYGVGVFNFVNFEMLNVIFEVGNEENFLFFI